MDPDATLQRIFDAIREKDYEEVGHACDDLTAWIYKEGFLPEKPIPFPAGKEDWLNFIWAIKYSYQSHDKGPHEEHEVFAERMSRQPEWKFIGNFGDATPIDHGGLFLFIDQTGVYPPEAEKLVPPGDGDKRWTVYRFVLEPCSYVNGILSDNRFHQDHPAWFAKPESERKERPQDTTYLKDLCETCDMSEGEFIQLICSSDPKHQLQAWRCVGDHHGYNNLDDYPLELTRISVMGRYQKHPYTKTRIP